MLKWMAENDNEFQREKNVPIQSMFTDTETDMFLSISLELTIH